VTAAVNRGWTYRDQVDAARAGGTVLDYLTDRYRHTDRAGWARRIHDGEVAVGGVTAHAETRLRGGEVVAWHRPGWDEPDVPLRFDVLHEDADVVAVAKPSGLPTMPAGGFLTHTLLHLVHARYPEARPLHRLGRATSGVVVFARTAAAAAALSRAWRDHAVAKDYRAVVAGRPAWERLEVDAAIGPVPHPRLGTVHAAHAAGRPARSLLRVLERRDATTLLEVTITTGRPHQIRIHTAWAGHPLAGDPLYAAGGLPSVDPGLPGDGGYLLHAFRVAGPHPRGQGELVIEAPPPPELRPGGAPSGST
jgi:23S rRNA pseudouridine1911/1915/1917 synthase